MTFNYLKNNFTKLAHYRLKIRKVIEFFFEFQSLTQHPLCDILSLFVVIERTLPIWHFNLKVEIDREIDRVIDGLKHYDFITEFESQKMKEGNSTPCFYGLREDLEPDFSTR